MKNKSNNTKTNISSNKPTTIEKNRINSSLKPSTNAPRPVPPRTPTNKP